MASIIQVSNLDRLEKLAQRFLGDSNRWREIAQLNDLNPLEFLPTGDLAIPSDTELRNVLGSVRTKVEAVTEQVSNDLERYTQIAIDQVDEINNTINGEIVGVKSKLEKVIYPEGRIDLIDWILDEVPSESIVNRVSGLL